MNWWLIVKLVILAIVLYNVLSYAIEWHEFKKEDRVRSGVMEFELDITEEEEKFVEQLTKEKKDED